MSLFRLSLLVCLAFLAGCESGRLKGTPDATAELPREQVRLDVSSPGRVIRVAADADLQAALVAAQPGDTIELEAGATFTGPFVLPHKAASEGEAPPASDSPWITLRPGPAAHSLPAAGTRVTPSDAPAMARLESSKSAVLTTAPGASHYRFIGIEFGPGPHWLKSESGASINGLVWLHSGSASPDDIPHHFIFERCLFAGESTVGTRRGLVVNSAHTAVVDSHFSDFKMVGEDAQAIVGWAGPGPFLIRNNYLEGSGENVMFGGGDPPIEGLVPSDIEIIGNHFAKPLDWQEGHPDFEGTRWSVKNLFELKNAQRVLVDGNLLEYNWPESQNGFAILFTVRNQDGDAPWSVVRDVTFSNNVVRHVASAFNISGFDDHHQSQQTQRIVIRNNLFEDVGGTWGKGDLFQALDGVANLTIEHNTARHTGRILVGEGRVSHNFRFSNNIVFHNEYGIVGTDITPGRYSLDHYYPDAVFAGNRIIGGARQGYPRGNVFPREAGAPREEAAKERNAKHPGKALAGVNFDTLCGALSVTERLEVCSTGEASAP